MEGYLRFPCGINIYSDQKKDNKKYFLVVCLITIFVERLADSLEKKMFNSGKETFSPITIYVAFVLHKLTKNTYI
jgi:hypothetical protein